MTRGGKRDGAGRRAGSGKWGETTKQVRLPESRIDDVYEFLENGTGYEIPLYSSTVQAGFPAPADDYMEGKIDLNQYLIQHPTSTFFVRVAGESMIKAGIFPDDLLIVDRSIDPKSGKIVIAVLDGELTVKRLHKTPTKTRLLPENDDFSPIEISNDNDLTIWGVVTNVIHPV